VVFIAASALALCRNTSSLFCLLIPFVVASYTTAGAYWSRVPMSDTGVLRIEGRCVELGFVRLAKKTTLVSAGL
jgi:hypothetical protein